MQMSNLEDVSSELVWLKRITDWGLGAEPPAAGGNGGLGEKSPDAGQFL